jgi:hypothetical protein
MTAATNGLGHPPKVVATVTADDIETAKPRNSNTCMVAEALKRARPKFKFVAVDIQTIRATDPEKGERYIWLTPRSIQQAIVDFDGGKKPDPFQFRLWDGQTIAAGRRSNWAKGRKTSKARLRKAKSTRVNHAVPVKVGGKAPPKAIGSRRAFGLRSLAY